MAEDSPFVAMLVDMGFSKERSEKALKATGNVGVQPAMDWLFSNTEDEVPQTGASSAETQVSPQESSSAQSSASTATASTEKVEYHATKSGHDSFSESLEEKKPLTEDEKKEKLKQLEEKMRQKRKEREELEKQESLEKEKIRIKSGKEMAEAKKKMEELEMKKLLEQRKREKEEDRIARQAIREKIEADKAARRAKAAAEYGNLVPSVPVPTPAPAPAPAPTPAAPKRDYTETRLQIRLTNGDTLTQTFGAKEQLSAVRLYIEMNRTDPPGPFNLLTNFPRKVFSFEDYDAPLDVLGLVPSAVVIVQKKVE
ncbi:Similar to ubxn1-a: UBX domain-containing protein 1-A (Xenopus laevis) [Cotesia congregata]|uniref:Similar to ubxn1-a: UBX domain-containing protein 1-A (Xenopus laevis) n=1 Tax=Cotesia congregata TaxID=51543 RepID=A0A8J2EC65_COTCN|nr:Similar to ubxn1-a: UBX domain-containing protein 1-A (Xenopus laevis) [Cotesia congregata]